MEYSKENIRKIYIELGIYYLNTMAEKIQKLYMLHGQNLTSEYQKFYKLYIGNEVTKEDILDSLVILNQVLFEFYNSKVIVLVDEHDAGAHNLYTNIKLKNDKKNKKIMKSINYYSRTITEILRRIGNDNDNYTEKLLVFGITNSIIKDGISGLDNIKIKDVFDTEYSDWFAMTKQEMSCLVDRLFDNKTELTGQIKINTDDWYNGYYGKNGSSLYSLFSAGLYISDCFYEYNCKGKTIFKIPEPSKHWVKGVSRDIFDDYLNIRVDGRFNFFITELWKGDPAFFGDTEEGYAPLLQNITNKEERPKILLHLLLHCGFLTQDKRKEKCFRIPNLEIFTFFEDTIKFIYGHMNFNQVPSADLIKSLEAEDFPRFGREMLKILNFCSKLFESMGDKFKIEGDRQSELFLYSLLWDGYKRVYGESKFYPSRDHDTALIDSINVSLNDNTNLTAINSTYAQDLLDDTYNRDESGKGVAKNYLLPDNTMEGKIQRVLELKTPDDNTTAIEYYAFKGLKQILDKNYHQNLLKMVDTDRVVSIGIGANTTHASIAVLKNKVGNGSYVFSDITITYQSFFYTMDSNGNSSIEQSEEIELNLGYQSTSFGDSETPHSWNETDSSNQSYRDRVSEQIEQFMHSIKINQLAHRVKKDKSPINWKSLAKE